MLNAFVDEKVPWQVNKDVNRQTNKQFKLSEA
jgi:hypothetical protein